MVLKTSYFINTTGIFVEWIINNDESSDRSAAVGCLSGNMFVYFFSIRLFYGKGDLGFFTPNVNIFCLALLECLWKIFTMILIFRSIQYLRDYCLHKDFYSTKSLSNENPSSTQLIIHIIPNNTIVNKQFNV